jgi:hypothetical protein
VGIQIKTVYWGGSTVSRFINRMKIDDVIINEGISFWQIKSYMAILVKDEDKMVVVFEVKYYNIRFNMRILTMYTTEYVAKVTSYFTSSLSRYTRNYIF